MVTHTSSQRLACPTMMPETLPFRTHLVKQQTRRHLSPRKRSLKSDSVSPNQAHPPSRQNQLTAPSLTGHTVHQHTTNAVDQDCYWLPKPLRPGGMATKRHTVHLLTTSPGHDCHTHPLHDPPSSVTRLSGGSQGRSDDSPPPPAQRISAPASPNHAAATWS